MPLYENYGFSNTTYSPLCGGFLTGKYLEGVPEDSRCGKDNGWYRKERASNRFLNKYSNYKINNFFPSLKSKGSWRNA